MTYIAGVVEASSVLEDLSRRRSVFHSEADLQHAFAWSIQQLVPSLEIRLEVLTWTQDKRRQHLDLLCWGDRGRTAIELKYIKAAWDGNDPITGENVQLLPHAADDLARRDFVFDIARLERVCAMEEQPTDGLAVMLTNVKAMWSAPAHGRPTRDRNFRVHDGRTLSGSLVWGEGDFSANDRDLSGTYTVEWRRYCQLPGRNGDFRWLAIPIAAVSSGRAV